MPKTDEKLDPKYLDFIYRNTGGKMGKPLPKEQTPQPQTPPPEIKKYDFPENRLAKFLYAFGGGNPAAIDQMALSRQQHQSMYDPMSERSRVARDLASKIGAPATPDLSAGDIESYLPSYEKLLAMQSKGSGGPKQLKLSEGERKAAGFAQRIREASDILSAIDPSSAAPTFFESKTGIEIPGYFKSAERQRAEQATRNFINAQLRRESGALIGPTESADANKQYIPQPGDSPEVIAQKRKDRENAFRNMKFEAGPAYEALQAEYATPEMTASGPTNLSAGKGDVTKETWALPNGKTYTISPQDPEYNEFISDMKTQKANRVK